MVCGQQPLLRALIPKTLQRKTNLAAGDADADVLRSDIFHRVRLIKYDEIVPKEQPSFHFVIHPSKKCEEERVVQHQNIGGENSAAGPLKEAKLVLFGHFGLMAADF